MWIWLIHLNIPRKNQVIRVSLDRNVHLCALSEKNPSHSLPQCHFAFMLIHSSRTLIIFLKISILLFLCMCVLTRVYVQYMNTCVCRGQRAREPLKLELQVAVSLLLYVLGSGHRSSERAECAFDN